jgi:hypothetical protein
MGSGFAASQRPGMTENYTSVLAPVRLVISP